ncbi:TetR/AcrR family transcriptional regulator [Sphingosinicella microcystinivorans]|uniref:TetR family transcriptional regulator n=1 Tax=Sphingosinicella microcystinivorans TaxID=335406 RepID=A0ABX9T4W1_SPHMI|nr:TetR/AcrR family transcriptional regulator [Sphingosinicella microcystinivorans]RKS94265.1 TetR family transcriptional regulator [Sphingosinicella microcystinivorans]
MQPRTDDLSFTKYLERRLQEAPPPRKSQRTRERLKIAAAQLLASRGYHEISSGAVSAEAGLAEGSFYIYFKDKVDVTRTVLDEFADNFVGPHLAASAKPAASAFEAIRNSNRLWIDLAFDNPGLFRCLLQFADEDSAFGAKMQRRNFEWHIRIARSTWHNNSSEESILLVYLLGGMVDDLIRKLVVYLDKQLQQFLVDLRIDRDGLVDVVSLVWLKILHPYETFPSDISEKSQRIAELLTAAPRKRQRR